MVEELKASITPGVQVCIDNGCFGPYYNVCERQARVTIREPRYTSVLPATAEMPSMVQRSWFREKCSRKTRVVVGSRATPPALVEGCKSLCTRGLPGRQAPYAIAMTRRKPTHIHKRRGLNSAPTPQRPTHTVPLHVLCITWIPASLALSCKHIIIHVYAHTHVHTSHILCPQVPEQPSAHPPTRAQLLLMQKAGGGPGRVFAGSEDARWHHF